MDEQTKAPEVEVKSEVQVSKETSLNDILDAVKELTKAVTELSSKVEKVYMQSFKAGRF